MLDEAFYFFMKKGTLRKGPVYCYFKDDSESDLADQLGISEEEEEVKEDQKTEFKTSIFVDPERHGVGFRQMQTIADTLAAFMNAEGGMLYVGITDDQKIAGIAGDLDILGSKVFFTNPEFVVRRLLAHFGIEPNRVALRG